MSDLTGSSLLFWTVPALRYYKLCLCLLSFKQYKTDHRQESCLRCIMHIHKRSFGALDTMSICLFQSLMLVFYICRCVLIYTRWPNVKYAAFMNRWHNVFVLRLLNMYLPFSLEKSATLLSDSSPQHQCSSVHWKWFPWV